MADLALEGIDIHETTGTIDYFVWLIRHKDRLVLVDTGFSAEEGNLRGRTMIIHPVEALRQLGIASTDITDVIVTHLHYDHAGNLTDFPNAIIHLQDREMEYGTGRCMCHVRMQRPFAAEATIDAVRLVYAGKVRFHDGDGLLIEGVSMHLIGGHSRGLQVVRLEHDGEVVVVASDALHFARYLADDNAFPLFADYPDVLDGYRTLRRLAGPTGAIVPGHDSCVLTDFPSLTHDLPFARVLL